MASAAAPEQGPGGAWAEQRVQHRVALEWVRGWLCLSTFPEGK